MVNPIVTSIFYICFAFFTIMSKTWFGLSFFLILSLIILSFNTHRIKAVFKQTKPFFLFLPIMIGIYIIISVIFTNIALWAIINAAVFAMCKLLLVVLVMSLYLEISKDQDLILSLRTLWSKFNLKWRWVEDLFMFLELTLRFYPTFQREWQAITESKKALGLYNSSNKWERVRSATEELPSMIMQSYRKAENTAYIMKQRGYGNQIPRGIANPIPFKISDSILVVLIIIGYALFFRYGTL